MVGSGDDAIIAVSHTLCSLKFIAFRIGFQVIGEKFKGLVDFLQGGFVVLPQSQLPAVFHELVEAGHLFFIELFLLTGFGQFFLGQLVGWEDLAGCLELHDGCVIVVFGQQGLALAHGKVEGILLVLPFFQDGTHRIGLTANVFVLGEDLQGGFVFRQCLLVFLLAIELVACIEVGIEDLLACTVFLDFLDGFVKFLLGCGVARLLFQGHLVIGLRADVVLGVELVVAFLHQRFIRFGVLGLCNIGSKG